MAYQFGAAAKLRIAAIAMGLFTIGSTGPLYASARAVWPDFTVVVEKANEGPPGWAEFCRNYQSECDVKPTAPLKITLTSDVWNKLSEVNQWANTHIKPTPDRKHWGRINKWYFAEDGRGDCKDYVLVKRRMLEQAGLPREALLITVVWTPQDQGHAVLIVRMDKGDYILDNLSSKILLWRQTPYDYVMRQSQSNPNAWVFIDGDPLKPTKVAENIAENPASEPAVAVGGFDGDAPKQDATKPQVVVADSVHEIGSKPQVLVSLSADNSAVSATNNVPADPGTLQQALQPNREGEAETGKATTSASVVDTATSKSADILLAAVTPVAMSTLGILADHATTDAGAAPNDVIISRPHNWRDLLKQRVTEIAIIGNDILKLLIEGSAQEPVADGKPISDDPERHQTSTMGALDMYWLMAASSV